MKLLNSAVTDKSTSEDDAFRTFVESFGTHYFKHAKFGSKLIYEKKYVSRSKNSEEKETRSFCAAQSASGCVEGGVAAIGASAGGCANTNTTKCNVSLSVFSISQMTTTI